MTSPLENLCGPGKSLRREPLYRFSGASAYARSGPGVWGVLAKCHDVRNLGEYEGELNVDERLLADIMTVRAEREKLKAELVKLEEQMAVYLKELGYE